MIKANNDNADGDGDGNGDNNDYELHLLTSFTFNHCFFHTSTTLQWSNSTILETLFTSTAVHHNERVTRFSTFHNTKGCWEACSLA